MKFKKVTSFILSLIMAVSSLNMCFAEELQTSEEAQTEIVTEAETEDTYIKESNVLPETEAEETTEVISEEEEPAEDIVEEETVISAENDSEETTLAEETKDNTDSDTEEPIFASVIETIDDIELKADFGSIAHPVTDGNIYFNPNTGAIIDADDTITSVDIPKVIDGYSVTSISYDAFKNCTSLTSITIPDGVTSIGSKAFYGCKSLTIVTIPDSVTSISSQAFYGCTSLTSVIIPDNVTDIGSGAFGGCTSLTNVTIGNGITNIDWWAFKDCTSLTSITIPDSVTYIGLDAFEGCTSLTNVTIPDNVTDIGGGAFSGCTLLTSINVSENNTAYSSINGVLYNRDKTELVKMPEGKGIKEFNIPDSVTSIGQHAFDYCTLLTNVTIPNSVTSIGVQAFYGCTSLTNITIPDSVTSIDNSAFYSCKSLTSINVSENNAKYSSIDGVLYNKDKTKLIKMSEGSKIREFNIPDNVTSIGDSAFKGCILLTNITIPDGVTDIEYDTFYGCSSLTGIIIPDSVTSIDDYSAFYRCDKNKLIFHVNQGSYADIWAKKNGWKVSYINVPAVTELTTQPTTSKPEPSTQPTTSKPEPTTQPTTSKPEPSTQLTTSKPEPSTQPTTSKTEPTTQPTTQSPTDKPAPSDNVDPPSFTVKGVFGGRTVTFNCATKGAVIYYTKENRSDLKLTDPRCSIGKSVTFNSYYGTIYARAYYNGKWSNVARLILKIPKVNDPTITKLSNGKVKIKTTTPSCIVYYTTDGSTPSANNYAGKFWTSHDVKIPAGKTVKAIAVRSCFSDSKVTTGKA